MSRGWGLAAKRKINRASAIRCGIQRLFGGSSPRPVKALWMIFPAHDSYRSTMKFSVSKDKLLEGLSTVQNVVSTRTTLPILSNVLLQASDGEIRLTTTDLDVGYSEQ